jgi:hypothetical protein
VSAGLASPAAKGAPAVSGDLVRALQHALYRAARADPGRRLHALYDKVSRSDVLWRAWVAVRLNNGAPGIDKVTLAAVEEYGVARLLGELAAELREGRYRPLPAAPAPSRRRLPIGRTTGSPPGSRQAPLELPGGGFGLCWQTPAVAVAEDPAREVLLRRGFVLEYVMLAWNAAGIVVVPRIACNCERPASAA